MKFIIEFKKIFIFKNILLILFVIIIPWLFSVLIITNNSSVNISGEFDLFSFSFTIWEIMKILLVVIIIPVYVTCCNIGREISNKSVLMYITKVSNVYYYNVKILSNYLYSFIMVFCYLFSSTIAFNVLLRNSNHFSNITISNWVVFYTILMMILEVLLYVTLAHLMSIRFNHLGGTFLTIVILILLRILKNVSYIKKYIPEEIGNFVRIMNIKEIDLLKDFYFNFLYILLLVILFYFMGFIYIKNKEFK
ncbi:hypothetical protein [Staphylococcus pseudintermedius]|uniref:hypothetical protein n=1 Tax=Staphylococcus pseudintermedius TaxID=283734 RepID=UPI002185F9E3|nr:hypothetical protein [Staphylococcus pseudintermedius]EIQ3872086.1 hypothetical protein [Staphylococcus pseudintermedius]EJA1900646.1 hypothetical protein [Staphylococcus pseudintermedius]MDK3605888.1 hypothetical protein [Staphylococcus pseudintermedius]MDT0927339.1 hypothetical protein [Staphylococcus pseudintermedius]UAS15599.1 hypothetical protein K9F08_09205 [Staphylococcus pseudintermedius]